MPAPSFSAKNGWGKSTLADLLRSLSTNTPDIVIGRKTLAGGLEQKAVVRFGDQQAVFEGGAWTGIRPRIAVYDSVFVNENVFSGDVVTNEHLKNQYGMVVGEEGVRRVRRIVELDSKNRENNSQSRGVEAGAGRHREGCRAERYDPQGVSGPRSNRRCRCTNRGEGIRK